MPTRGASRHEMHFCPKVGGWGRIQIRDGNVWETGGNAMKREDEKLLPLEQVAKASEFDGFTEEDFAVFEAPDFSDRMQMLKQKITPKL